MALMIIAFAMGASPRGQLASSAHVADQCCLLWQRRCGSAARVGLEDVDLRGR